MASSKPPGKSWVYDLILIDKDDRTKKYCTLCPEDSKPIKCGNKNKSNTTNLSYHLLKHHLEEATDVRNKHMQENKLKIDKRKLDMGEIHYRQSTIKETLNKKEKWNVNDSRAMPYHDAVVQYIIGENKPINTVEQ